MYFFGTFFLKLKKEINVIKERVYINNHDWLIFLSNHIYLNWKYYLFFSCVGTISVVDIVNYIKIIEELNENRNYLIKCQNIIEFTLNETEIKDYSWIDNNDKNTLINLSKEHLVLEDNKFKERKNFDEDSAFDLDLSYSSEDRPNKKDVYWIDINFLNDIILKAKEKQQNIEKTMIDNQFKWYTTKNEIKNLVEIEDNIKNEINNKIYEEKELKKKILRRWLVVINIGSLLLISYFS